MLDPMSDKKRRHVPGGKRDDTGDHDLSRRSLRVESPHESGWTVKSDDQKEKEKMVLLIEHS